MALVAHSTSVAAHGSLHQENLRYPRYYAGRGQSPVQNEQQQQSPPFIYTDPKLQSDLGSRKAKKVLGLVAQFESKKPDEEAPRGGPKKAQRTLGLVTDLPRDRRSWRNSGAGEFSGAFEQKLKQAEMEIRRMSRMQDLAVDPEDEAGAAADDERSDGEEEQRAHEEHPQEDDEEEEQPDPEKSRFLSLSLHESPQQLTFPRTPVELDAGPDHELLLPPPRPRARIRPHSYAAPRFSERPTNKIASSRCRNLRANSEPPNFSRPLSVIAPKPIPGEDMERDPLSIRFQDIEDDPRSPMSPIGVSPVGGSFVTNEIKAALEKLEIGVNRSRAGSPIPTAEIKKAQRKSRARWSSLPSSLMKFAAKKRFSKSSEDEIREEEEQSKIEVVTLTEDNLQRWEDEVGYVPKMHRLGYDLLKSPVEMDMTVERATPVPVSKTPSPRPDVLMMARAQGQILTPPLSPPMSPFLRWESSNGSTIGAQPSMFVPRAASPLSQHSFTPSPSFACRTSTTSTLLRRFPEVPIYDLPPMPPHTLHSVPSNASLAEQKEALSMTPNQLLTCVMCKEVEHPSAFPAQPLSADCMHAARTCKDCMQHWVERHLYSVEGVCCPECGVGMSREEVEKVVGEEMLRGGRV